MASLKQENEQEDWRVRHNTFNGVLIGTAFHVIAGAIFWNIHPSLCITLGVNQVIYMAPLIILALIAKAPHGFLKGLCLTGAIVFMLTVATCGFPPFRNYFMIH